MRIIELSSELPIQAYLKKLGVDGGGVEILASKAELHLVSIENLHVGAANILKQDALSIGADLAVPRGTILAEKPYVNALLIANTKALKILAKKELSQPFGLKELAKKLREISQLKRAHHAEIMGIINANDDSFFSSSRFKSSDAIVKIEKMIEEGAAIIDVGAVSSRPNAPIVSLEEELERIRPILALIKEQRLYEKVRFSLDSYQPEVLSLAFESGFCILNDITGLQDDRLCRLAGEYNAEVVIMHMQGKPQNMQDAPSYENVVDDIYHFFEQRIKKAESFGIEKIILDVGIGFGKSLEHNLLLIKHLRHFATLQKELLVGVSRKSMIDKISPSSVEERLAGTLALHLEAVRNGASIVRVHDVFEHAQALRVQEALFRAL